MKRQFRTAPPPSPHCPSTILSKLEPVVGLALHYYCIPTLTNSKQLNRLRSFPSEIKVSEVVTKIKNHPANSVSKFSHYSSSIILLELLLELPPTFVEISLRSETLSSFSVIQPLDRISWSIQKTRILTEKK